jgi:hypothetical protein
VATHRVGPSRSLSPPAGPLARVWAEVKLTVRLTVDNAAAAFAPGLGFTAAACAHYGVRGAPLAGDLAASVALFALYLYVFDASNQAAAGQEDRVNKPHRPIPTGLATPTGLMRRFWPAMAAYTLLGALTETLAWVLLWQAVVIGLNLLARPRDYLWVKPVAMFAGIIAQLAAAWRLAGPIDATGWRWILTLAVVFSLPMRIEDVRDMDGDRRAGRTTLPLLIGHWPVRLWFALVSVLLPAVLHLLLFAPSPAGVTAVIACDAVMVTMNWTAAALTLAIRTPKADRVSYQLHCLTYFAAVTCGAVLL